MPPSLSNDILLLIGEFLEDHQDRYNLLFVCRHFHGLFRRLVYRYAALKDCSQTRSFLSAALRHPELARAVRALDLSGWRTHSEAYEGTSVTVDEMEVFRNWAQEISHSDEEYIQWEQDLQQDVAEAWMALLLPLVRNVQQLRLVYPKENKYLDRMMQRAVQREKPFDTQPAFRALRQVSLGHLDDTLDSKGTYAPSQPAAFYRSLSASKHTLHTLWLDSCGVHLPFTMTGANETHEEWFGSLADFKSLKDVRIRLPNLLDIRYQAEPSVPLTELLPAGVESLYVEGCKENSLAMLVNQLRTLLSARHNGGVDGESGQPPRFKDLKKLEIEGMFHDEEDYDDSGYEGFAAGAKVIKPRVYEMVRPLRRDCEFSGVGLFIRDRVCPETMK
ncbi:hypothetical protein KXX06_006979 [Aspergillus fumigatus]|nr:hypothetical protein KXX06_006979 [Aspergillus fumigatus]